MPMTAYIVTARPGSSNYERYIDSIWISEFSALDRKAALMTEWDRSGKNTSTDWRAWVSGVTIEDAALALEPQRAHEPKDQVSAKSPKAPTEEKAAK